LRFTPVAILGIPARFWEVMDDQYNGASQRLNALRGMAKGEKRWVVKTSPNMVERAPERCILGLEKTILTPEYTNRLSFFNRKSRQPE